MLLYFNVLGFRLMFCLDAIHGVAVVVCCCCFYFAVFVVFVVVADDDDIVLVIVAVVAVDGCVGVVVCNSCDAMYLNYFNIVDQI